jgi:hypothetical protein
MNGKLGRELRKFEKEGSMGEIVNSTMEEVTGGGGKKWGAKN